MGKKMKKLICALLASAMLVSSVGIVAFADADKNENAADTTATETVDTAENTDAAGTVDEPEATEAPVVTGTAYDNDNYYQKALALCSSLGIITGYEDGSVKPDSKVTRAEMASIVLRMLAITSWSPYQNGFTDVTTAHWAADQIQAAQDASIISGMGDGTFVPDGDVTYAQVVVMLVNAMNYQDDAEYYGGWPNGYLKAAALSDLDLLKNAPGVVDEATDRGVVIKMVYNALLGQYKEINGYENGAVVYKAKGTLAKAKFDVIDKKGVLLGTSKTSITNTDLQENQVEIQEDKAEKAEVFDCSLKGLEDYIAQKVTYYYKQNSGKTPEVLAVTYDSSKSETYTIKDAEDIEKVEGFEDGAGKIKVSGVNKAKDCTGATVIYNGKVVEESDITKWLEKNEGMTVNDLYTPEKGSIKLVDSDKDNVYDVMFVDSYETMIISSVGTDKFTAKVSIATEDNIGLTKAETVNLDDSVDRTITVTRAGAEVKVRNLKKNDVATVKRSLDESVVDIVVTGESITGSASGITKKLDGSKATINGDKYEVANIAVNDLKTGTQSVFYLDMFGRVAYIESNGTGQLQTGEKYGWIMAAYDSENGDDYLVQIMTTDGKAVEFSAGTKLDYWGPKDTTNRTLNGDEVKTTIENLMAKDANFIIASSTKTPIRLVKYKSNSTNTLSRLYVACDSSVVTNEDAVRVNKTDLTGVPVSSGLVSNYQINDGIIEISVPKNAADMKDADNYKFGTVTATAYVVRENGSSRNYVVGEFTNSMTPSLLINFTASSDALASIDDIDTAGNNPVMVVDEIDSGVDDDDNEVYTIHGYVNGAEASITTSKNTVVGQITNSPTGNKKVYGNTTIWDAKNGGAAAYAGKALNEILHEGDLILYDSGDRILRLYDVNAVYESIVNGKGKVLTGSHDWSSTRNQFRFYPLEDSGIEDNAYVTLVGGITLSFDSSKLMDTVEINIKSGKATIDTEGSEVSDLVNYDATAKTGDYVFARLADKGNLQEVIIYRFVD